MRATINSIVVIAIIAASISAIHYYVYFLPGHKIQQDKEHMQMEESAMQDKKDRRDKMEARYHDCMQEAESSYGDQIGFCEDSCKARGLGDDLFCFGYATKLVGPATGQQRLIPNSNCPPLTPWQEQKVERDFKGYQDRCLNEMKAGVENLL